MLIVLRNTILVLRIFALWDRISYGNIWLSVGRYLPMILNAWTINIGIIAKLFKSRLHLHYYNAVDPSTYYNDKIKLKIK